ncbi:MAG: FHA domain-containing protein [Cyanobacteria bacterium P01_A01_bin.15]
MIICPNCNYQNPEAASQCEACYTPLPSVGSCPNCGAEVQTDASFCGQCGHSLATQPTAPAPPPADLSSPGLVEPDPLVFPDPLSVAPPPPLPVSENIPTAMDIYGELPTGDPVSDPVTAQATVQAPAQATNVDVASPQTQLQSLSARLLHVQTETIVELPVGLDLVHVGKPNDRIPPDIDVSGFPESEIVSRVHANIRIEGDVYYIEDIGSSNGTYVNNLPLAAGNRHRLRAGDRIALGKGDKVSFIFQLA